ncbi:MAG: YkgJ family cysteine cluster protein, partial [Candidatus Odinarchaeota archaeon]
MTVPLSRFDVERIVNAPLKGNIDQFVNFETNELVKNMDGCVFLINGRCSIYDYRPDVCRLFPYNFRTVGNETELETLLMAHELAEFVCFKERGDVKGMKQLQEAILTVKEILQRGLMD